MVASNAVLKAMARTRPTTNADLLRVKGVGPAMVERYGKALMTIFLRFPAE
jgi:superfamily II DNA helicase RecQ